MNAHDDFRLRTTRRQLLGRATAGIGSMALASLLNPKLFGAVTPASGLDRWDGVVRPLHAPAKCKRVIWLYMAGGPSHLETFDHKPRLAEMHGQPMPDSFTKGQPIAHKWRKRCSWIPKIECCGG